MALCTFSTFKSRAHIQTEVFLLLKCFKFPGSAQTFEFFVWFTISCALFPREKYPNVEHFLTTTTREFLLQREVNHIKLITNTTKFGEFS